MTQVKPKFKIGEFVTLAESTEHAIKIASIFIETCPGGTQIHYAGKCYKKEMYFGKDGKDSTWRPFTHNDKWNEIELGKVVKREKAND